MLNYGHIIQITNHLMSTSPPHLVFNHQEERINALTHGLGAVLAIVAAVLLTKKGMGHLSTTQMTGLVVYSISMVILFLASTLYHSIESPKIRVFLKQLDLKPEPQYYEPCSNQEIIKRILRNLISSYENSGLTEKVEELTELLMIASEEHLHS
ncbi:MAG: hypothetical protein EOO07_37140 [Chitinophagaceae bacterium]|nr:MAG: hypothetical protein EOO07_37140 [Chitinophagaceae bacterium]